MLESIRKFPRTPHLEGSRRQPGDHDLPPGRVSELIGKHVVVEEKLDGANAGVSFSADGELRLQSRGHFLSGGDRERHFSLFKTWATVHRQMLWDLLGPRRVLYGEWLFARHTIFYDVLPHFFVAFDLLDAEEDRFLPTSERHEELAETGIVSAPVLFQGPFAPDTSLPDLVAMSRFKSDQWRERLVEAAQEDENGLWGSVERAIEETDPSDLAEGLYLRVEEGDRVVQRLKWVRPSFRSMVAHTETHWLTRPILPNRLAEGAALW